MGGLLKLLTSLYFCKSKFILHKAFLKKYYMTYEKDRGIIVVTCFGHKISEKEKDNN